jgi:hypothetical protein
MGRKKAWCCGAAAKSKTSEHDGRKKAQEAQRKPGLGFEPSAHFCGKSVWGEFLPCAEIRRGTRIENASLRLSIVRWLISLWPEVAASVLR